VEQGTPPRHCIQGSAEDGSPTPDFVKNPMRGGKVKHLLNRIDANVEKKRG
jgi:hypothetical protein